MNKLSQMFRVLFSLCLLGGVLLGTASCGDKAEKVGAKVCGVLKELAECENAYDELSSDEQEEFQKCMKDKFKKQLKKKLKDK